MLHEDLSAEGAPPSAGELLELQLSALLFLLTRCACRPGDGAAMRLALEHLELLGRNGQAPVLVRRTASRVAKQWREETEPAGESGPPAPCCGRRLH
ncbi:MAG: hypothetical protein H0W40_13120 [Methylibium sp.]|uniref:hypothetical protein n=1 Tax=Methylibium sp. TaxID=2067992 RepID=UPI00180F1484|nr:hypothetical protein [Methylibium sp.]MBA3598296.1 hypothetical protein [Methylibium sp.]